MDKCHDACHGSADCSGGQRCVETDKGTVCQLPAEATCAQTMVCSGTLVCASDLRCRAGCLSPADCAEKQVCVTGVCADTTEINTSGQLPQLAPDGGAKVALALGATPACVAGVPPLFLYWSSIIPLLFLYFSPFFLN